MKKLVALLLSFVICISFSSCHPLSSPNTISHNDDASEIYYNGQTYINYNNTNGKYRFNIEADAEHWIKIATIPYGFFYILGAVTHFYGNDIKNPDFITNSRTNDFYVRKDLTLDHTTELSICDTQDPYCFQISDVITSNSIKFNIDQRNSFTPVCNFLAAFKEFPFVKLWIEIYEYEDKFYLQDVWNSDYYEITDTFKEDLYRFGINTFDYH